MSKNNVQFDFDYMRDINNHIESKLSDPNILNKEDMKKTLFVFKKFLGEKRIDLYKPVRTEVNIKELNKNAKSIYNYCKANKVFEILNCLRYLIDSFYIESLDFRKEDAIEIVNSGIQFFKEIKTYPTFYNIAKNFINTEHSHINFSSIESHCFHSVYLGESFVNVENRGKTTGNYFIHELVHAVSNIINIKSEEKLSEFLSILYQTLYIDMIDLKKYNIKTASKLYADRLIDFEFCVKSLDQYLVIINLMKYKNFDTKYYEIINYPNVTKDFLLDLNVNSFVNKFKYVFSTLVAFYIRREFYLNRELTNEKIKMFVKGFNIFDNIDIYDLICPFIDHEEQVKKIYRKK